MAQKSAPSFSSISDYFKNNQKQLKVGDLLFLTGNVLKIIFDRDRLVKGKVKSNMKQTVYNVQVGSDRFNSIKRV